MTRYYERPEGWTRGGIDVESAVNQFFKLLLLSPIFLLAVFVSLAMLKHMIFGGIPVMNQPTDEQRDELRQRDEGVDPVPEFTPQTSEVSSVKEEFENALKDPKFVPAKVEEVPYVIYDSPQEFYDDSPKVAEPEGWTTEILNSPFE